MGARERLPVGRADVRVRGGGGHLEVLKWARANGCPWDWWTCANAAAGGHLEVWAHENDCPWNWETCTSRRLAATSRC